MNDDDVCCRIVAVLAMAVEEVNKDVQSMLVTPRNIGLTININKHLLSLALYSLGWQFPVSFMPSSWPTTVSVG